MSRGCHSGRELRRENLPPALAARLSAFTKEASPDQCWELDRPYWQTTHCGVTAGAHRWAAAWQVGVVPAGTVVRHSCDNPRCVNPRHLQLGTQGDNSRDMHQRGRAWFQQPGIPEAFGSFMKEQFASGARVPHHLLDRDRHPKNRAVIGPDGTSYPSSAQAAEALGLTRQAMSRRCRIGYRGWRYAA